ncbi:hypothetical protein V1509DRAFT_616511 [Lipomyces kononenkoae]
MDSDVHVYETLWTAQVTQKSKVWYDGTLKLHTFNKRAMLYDTSRVLIDSMFLSKGVLHSGDRLVMERHLVTIENESSTYTVDINSVIRRGLTQKRIASPISPTNCRSEPRLQPSCTTLHNSESALCAQSSSSNDFDVRSGLSKGALPKCQPIQHGDLFHIRAEKAIQSVTPTVSPAKDAQYQTQMHSAELSSPLPQPRISHLSRLKSPRVMEPFEINLSMHLGRASDKVHSPYRPPTSVLGSKPPNIGLSPSSGTAIYSTLDVKYPRPIQAPPPVRLCREADDNFKVTLLTPPDTSSPVKSSVIDDEDIHKNIGRDRPFAESNVAKKASLNMCEGVIARVQGSSELVLQQTYPEEEVHRALPTSQVRPTLSASPLDIGARYVDSLPEHMESREAGVRNDRLLNCQTQSSEQCLRGNDVAVHGEPRETYGVMNNDDRSGPVALNDLRRFHSPSSKCSGMRQLDDGSRRLTFSVSDTLEPAELTLTQSEPIKRRLLSVARKSSRRKIVR